MTEEDTRPDREEHELEPETIADLEPSADDVDEVRGGRCVAVCGNSVGLQSATN